MPEPRLDRIRRYRPSHFRMADIHRTTCLECGDTLSLDGSVGVTRMFDAVETDHSAKTGHTTFLHSVEPNTDDEPTSPYAVLGRD